MDIYSSRMTRESIRGLRHGEAGDVWLFAASMFAGKTKRLIAEAERFQRAGVPYFVVKHALDDRYEGHDFLSSHDGSSLPCEAISDPLDVYRRVVEKGARVVIWDEVQFYIGKEREIIAVVEQLAKEGVLVILAGLELDFRGELFGPMGELLARATRVEKLTAVCAVCGSLDADRTQRMVDGSPAKYNDALILVGASEAYEARCRRCHEVPGKPSFEEIFTNFSKNL